MNSIVKNRQGINRPLRICLHFLDKDTAYRSLQNRQPLMKKNPVKKKGQMSNSNYGHHHNKPRCDKHRLKTSVCLETNQSNLSSLMDHYGHSYIIVFSENINKSIIFHTIRIPLFHASVLFVQHNGQFISPHSFYNNLWGINI